MTPSHLYLRNGPPVFVLETHGTTNVASMAHKDQHAVVAFSRMHALSHRSHHCGAMPEGAKGFRGSNLASTSPETFHYMLPSGSKDAHRPRSQWDLSPVVQLQASSES